MPLHLAMPRVATPPIDENNPPARSTAPSPAPSSTNCSSYMGPFTPPRLDHVVPFQLARFDIDPAAVNEPAATSALPLAHRATLRDRARWPRMDLRVARQPAPTNSLHPTWRCSERAHRRPCRSVRQRRPSFPYRRPKPPATRRPTDRTRAMPCRCRAARGLRSSSARCRGFRPPRDRGRLRRTTPGPVPSSNASSASTLPCSPLTPGNALHALPFHFREPRQRQ